MHVHILAKVWNQKRHDWNTHSGSHVCMWLCKGGAADMGTSNMVGSCIRTMALTLAPLHQC